MRWLDTLLERYPDVRWKVRIHCVTVALICLACIVGHVTGMDVLYTWRLNLGMSLITAVCLLLVVSAIALMTKEVDNDASEEGN